MVRLPPATLAVVLTTVFISTPVASAQDAGVEFFEKKIRPVLVEHCYRCHSREAREQKQLKGGLLLDTRAGVRQGGDSGPAVVPGKPGASLLLESIAYSRDASRMPPKGKLPDAVIADVRRWIEMGAPDPREEVSTVVSKPGTWEETFRQRREWWSLQPLRKSTLPDIRNKDGADHPVDRFILTQLERQGLAPAPLADKPILLRRVTYALTGLPPTPAEVEAFLHDDAPDAYERVVERLLASPRFGERWATHFMDLVRYAESHGSEGDPTVPYAWRYRDYLIRAFNADVPYDRLVREHLAGDLLPDPRINRADGLNESILGLGHLRMMEHGFQPVDSLDELAKTVDNQIDVAMKAFQGLTVSCARCHDHKFDAISQRDYYALYGIFAASRPGQVTVDTPEFLRTYRQELAGLKEQIRAKLAEAWLREAEALPERLLHLIPPAQRQKRAALRQQRDTLRARLQAPPTALEVSRADPWTAALAEAAANDALPLYPWAALAGKKPGELAPAWQALATRWQREIGTRSSRNRDHFKPLWDLTRHGDFAQWYQHGKGSHLAPSAPGEFFIEPAGEHIINGIYPAGVYTHLLSQKHNGVFTSPRFRLPADSLSVRLLGGKGGGVRVIVDNYPLGQNGTYPQNRPARDDMGWVRLDTSYRKGSEAYLEFATEGDLTRVDRPNKAAPRAEDGRSYWGVAQVVYHNDKTPPRDEVVPILALLDNDVPASPAELAALLRRTLVRVVLAWRDGRLTDAEAAFLDSFVRRGLLGNSPEHVPGIAPLVAAYRRLEKDVPVPRRAPGVLEAAGQDQPLFVRGNPKTPGEMVPRGYLAALGRGSYHGAGTGRLQLAEDILHPNNPLTSRVMVNRVWHWLFGRGLVPTVDNFGRLGEAPTHPELLDYLAIRFVEQGWSVKALVRFLVTSRTYRMSSIASEQARRQDPANVWLCRARVQRLDAEAIRDGLLTATGELNLALYGPGVTSAPLDGGRRSVYLAVLRNAPHPFLEVFDKPAPATTRGQRDVTNTPGQALALMNSPFVTELAQRWGSKLAEESHIALGERIRRMFVAAVGRLPTDDEMSRSRAYLAAAAEDHGVALERQAQDPRPWQDLAQAILSLKETIYLR